MTDPIREDREEAQRLCPFAIPYPDCPTCQRIARALAARRPAPAMCKHPRCPMRNDKRDYDALIRALYPGGKRD